MPKCQCLLLLVFNVIITLPLYACAAMLFYAITICLDKYLSSYTLVLSLFNLIISPIILKKQKEAHTCQMRLLLTITLVHAPSTNMLKRKNYAPIGNASLCETPGTFLLPTTMLYKLFYWSHLLLNKIYRT